MLPITRKISKYNFSNNNNPKYIVIHDTGNKTDSAAGNANYFNTGNRNASAHYFVDDKNIYQVVEDFNASWHCGDGAGKYGITNYNSIGIEMCRVNNNVTETTINNTIELVKYLMNKYSIPVDKVVRHYDASRKICPSSLSANNWSRWNDFKNRLTSTNIKYTHIAVAQANIVQTDGTYISTIYAGQRCELKWITNDYRKYVRLSNGKEGLVEECKTKYIVPLEEAYTHEVKTSGEKLCVIWTTKDANCFVARDKDGEKLSWTCNVSSDQLRKIEEEPIKEEPKKETKGMYKVQSGVFSNKENAENLVKELKAKGFEGIIKEE